MKKLFGLLAIILCVLGCEKPEDRLSDSGVNLIFSNDTVSFDTLFTGQLSVSKRLKVYNPSRNAVNVNVELVGGASSPFQIIVNGLLGSEFQNIELLGSDSMLIVVDVLLSPENNDLPVLVEDLLIFENFDITQDVNLVAYGQDVIPFSKTVLPCSSHWTAARPYLLSDTVVVGENCTLTIDAGTQVFFDYQAILFIQGSLIVNGTPDSRCYFLNSRQTSGFENAPGQWRGIYFLEGSENNVINGAVVRNAENGFRIGTPDSNSDPDVIIRDCIIENMLYAGVIAFTSDVMMVNTLINNTGAYTFAGIAGGNYELDQVTLANYNFDFFRNAPAFVLSDNLVLEDKNVISEDLNAKITNSIIWGSLQEEITISETGEQQVDIDFSYSLLRTKLPLSGNDNILNEDPLFISPIEYNYHLKEESPASNVGLFGPLLFDLDGEPREDPTDLGCYEIKID